MDFADKMQRCHEYVEALQEEKRKIQVFERELPLCLQLVTQAIETCKKELSGTTTEYMHGQQQQQSECSEQTSSDVPVLEEFIPLKTNTCDDDDDENEEQHSNDSDKKKSDWLRSVQLWNQSPDPTPTPKEDLPRKTTVVEVKRNGGAFQPFNKEKSVGKSAVVAAPATSSTTETVSKGGGGSSSKKDQDKESQKREEKEKEKENLRKQRRCWSPELHRRFLHALQQLGGSHAATPKQIRELMKVDGLTNDEVKSHLQKYRLHTRRPSPTIHNNTNQQAPQFVVVGGIWMQPPHEYTAAAAKSSGEGTNNGVTRTNGIYAPVAAAPPPALAQSSSSPVKTSQQSGSHSEGGGHQHSNSPATSSSTHTTTASRV